MSSDYEPEYLDSSPTESEFRRRVLVLTDEQLSHIRLLITALRSGNFTQGRQRLTTIMRPSGKHQDCCLGVACKVAVGNGVPLLLELHENTELHGSGDGADHIKVLYYVGGSDDREMTLLPTSVRNWYGFASRGPSVFDRNGELRDLTVLNDDQDYTFEDIAYAIEATYIVPNLDRGEITGQLPLPGTGE